MSMFFGNGILRTRALLMDKAGDDKGGGGGSGTPDPAKELEAEKAKNADLLKRLEALEAAGKDKDKDKDKDSDLALKAQKERELKDKQDADTARLTKAMKFNMTVAEMFKTNASLLPKTVDGILAQAEKEKYANEMEKESAIKVALIGEFLAIQTNLDLLTDAQKNMFAEFNALTKNVKQERVQQIYDMVFEPAFESLKRVTKAKQVRDGEIDPANAKAAYAKRMADLSRQKFIKKGAK